MTATRPQRWPPGRRDGQAGRRRLPGQGEGQAGRREGHHAAETATRPRRRPSRPQTATRPQRRPPCRRDGHQAKKTATMPQRRPPCRRDGHQAKPGQVHQDNTGECCLKRKKLLFYACFWIVGKDLYLVCSLLSLDLMVCMVFDTVLPVEGGRVVNIFQMSHVLTTKTTRWFLSL